MTDQYYNPNDGVIPKSDYKLIGKKPEGANVPPSLNWIVSKYGNMSIEVWLSDPTDSNRAPLKFSFNSASWAWFTKNAYEVWAGVGEPDNQRRIGNFNKDKAEETLLIVGKDENGCWLSVVTEARPAKRRFYVTPPNYIKMKKPGALGEAMSYREIASCWWEIYLPALIERYENFKRGKTPVDDAASQAEVQAPAPTPPASASASNFDDDIPF